MVVEGVSDFVFGVGVPGAFPQGLSSVKFVYDPGGVAGDVDALRWRNGGGNLHSYLV